MKIEIFTMPIKLRDTKSWRLIDVTDVVYQNTEHKPEYMESKYRGTSYGIVSSVKPVVIYED